MDGGRVCESANVGVQEFRSSGVYEREKNARSGNGI